MERVTHSVARRLRLVTIIGTAAVALVVTPGAAAATTYCNQFLANGYECRSGWNYWYATDVTKDPGHEHLGFQNSNGTRKYKGVDGTYGYTDKNELGIGGYMYAFRGERLRIHPVQQRPSLCLLTRERR